MDKYDETGTLSSKCSVARVGTNLNRIQGKIQYYSILIKQVLGVLLSTSHTSECTVCMYLAQYVFRVHDDTCTYAHTICAHYRHSPI
jgi:hypothetical protein